MRRKIRLTESEFHSLVRRLVRETEKEMKFTNMKDYEDDDDEDYGSYIPDDMPEENDYDPKTVRSVANFFKKKLRRLDQDEIEDLQDMVVNPETENLAEMFLREDISDRKKSGRAMKLGGIGMMGAGMLGMISQAMGYTDAGDLMIAVHDHVERMGGGPVSAAVLIAGLVMALKGMATKSGY